MKTRRCGEFELAGYLANSVGPVPLVLDLRIAHERFGSSSDPSINGHLHYPNDVDRSLNDTDPDKIRKYRADYNNNPPNTISLMTAIDSTSGDYMVNLCGFYFYKLIGKLTVFFSSSGVQLAHSTSGQFHYRRAAFSSQLKSKIDNILTKATALRITSLRDVFNYVSKYIHLISISLNRLFP